MRTRLALSALLAGTLALGAASAQAVPGAWDVIVTVREDRVGADQVSVGARTAGYPADLLRSQMVALGDRLGHPARGVSVVRASDVVTGRCAVDGLIDETNGSLALAPIAQAFAGAPAPYTVRRMLVSFDGVRPGPRTAAYHTAGATSDLAFWGRLVGSSVEYDVELRSQNPARLVVHEAEAASRAGTRPASPSGGGRTDLLTIVLFAAAALAAGALVYCGLLLIGRRPVVKS